MNLYEASEQWATRPPDERFSSLSEMLKVCHSYQKDACQATVSFKSLKAIADKESREVKVSGREGLDAKLTYWAFAQLSSLAKAPASYLRKLPPNIAAECLNYGFAQNHSYKAQLELLFQPTHNNAGQLPLPTTAMAAPDHLLLRALTSEKYIRIWNWEIVERLISLTEIGWRVPPARPAFFDQPGTRPATEDDVLAVKDFLSINIGDPIAPAGLYASNHDMFAFLINEENRIDDGSDYGLSRGVFFENSEVGAKALRCTTFLYRHVCGNHIVWDASNVSKLLIRHIGKARDKFSNFVLDLKKYTNAKASKDEAKIKKAQSSLIADDKEKVLDIVFKRLNQFVSREELNEAFDLAEDNHRIDGDPHTVWGIAQGITRLSQQTSYADERAKLDRAAGKVIQIAF